MAVLAHEGTHTIIFGMMPLPIGSSLHDAYLARPDTSSSTPVVIVLHGIGGLDSTTKQLCRAFARHGFTTIAPNWYSGNGPRPGAPFDEAYKAYSRVSDTRALSVVDETLEWLASDDLEGPDTTAPVVIGLDLGGRLALLYSARNRSVGAVASAYGPLHGDEERELQVAEAIRLIGAPILGLYGQDDDLIAGEDVDAAQAVTPNGQWILYEGVGHGFLDADADGYDAGAEADALVRLVKLATQATASHQ